MPKKPPFSSVISALLNPDKVFEPTLLSRLSDLQGDEYSSLQKAWKQIPISRRRTLLEDMGTLAEDDTTLSFEAVGRLGAGDPEAEVRRQAARTLWEYEDVGLARIYLNLLEGDSDEGVRAAAARGLGRYVLLGEYEELAPDLLRRIEDRLLAVYSSPDGQDVRRWALESLGYSSRPEVKPLIEAAYHSGKTDWMVSALTAMGRSANEQWNPQVLEQLDSSIPEVRAEAAIAAGELSIEAAAERLLEMLEDPDEYARLVTIWSLSQIGGDGVREALDRLYDEAEDDEQLEYLQDALDNLEFTEEVKALPMLDLDNDGLVDELIEEDVDLPDDDFGFRDEDEEE
jgi:HEAT repeat protein